MTTATHVGNGVYVTSQTPGIIAHTDVAITNAASPYSVLSYDYVIRADATSGNITINLPTAIGRAGKEYHIFRTDILSSTNIVTLDGNSTETIDSNLTYRIYPGEYVKIESDGANWQIIARPTPNPIGYYWLKNSTNDRKYVAGMPNNAALITSTTSPAVGTLFALPLVVSKTTKFDIITFTISTNGAANAHAGIYRDTGNCYPGALIFDTGDIDCSTGNTKNTTITSASQIFQPDLYWLAWEASAATIQIRGVPGNSSLMGILGNGTSLTAAQPGYGYTVAHTYGAMPDPFTASATVRTNQSAVGDIMPAIGLRPL